MSEEIVEGVTNTEEAGCDNCDEACEPTSPVAELSSEELTQEQKDAIVAQAVNAKKQQDCAKEISEVCAKYGMTLTVGEAKVVIANA